MSGTARKFAALSIVGLLMLAGCGSERSGSDERYVCTDRNTNTRVDEDRCNDGGSNYGWWLLAAGAAYPAIGGSIASNSGRIATPKSTPKPLPSMAGTAPKATSGNKNNSKPNSGTNKNNSKPNTKPNSGSNGGSKPNSGSGGKVGGSSGGKVGGGSVGGGRSK